MRITFTVLLLAISVGVFAQNNRKGHIGISLGASAPVGYYSKNVDAKLGLNLNLIQFGYRFGKKIGIAGKWYGAANPTNYTATWGYGGIMVGPMVTFPVGDRFEWDLKAMGGFNSISLTTEEETTNSGITFAMGLGSAMRYNFSNRFALVLDADFFHALNGPFSISAIHTNLGILYRFN